MLNKIFNNPLQNAASKMNLSPYEIYQLENYGNILNNANPMDQFFSKPEKTTSEEVHIFKLENPE